MPFVQQRRLRRAPRRSRCRARQAGETGEHLGDLEIVARFDDAPAEPRGCARTRHHLGRHPDRSARGRPRSSWRQADAAARRAIAAATNLQTVGAIKPETDLDQIAVGGLGRAACSEQIRKERRHQEGNKPAPALTVMTDPDEDQRGDRHHRGRTCSTTASGYSAFSAMRLCRTRPRRERPRSVRRRSVRRAQRRPQRGEQDRPRFAQAQRRHRMARQRQAGTWSARTALLPSGNRGKTEREGKESVTRAPIIAPPLRGSRKIGRQFFGGGSRA